MSFVKPLWVLSFLSCTAAVIQPIPSVSVEKRKIIFIFECTKEKQEMEELGKRRRKLGKKVSC